MKNRLICFALVAMFLTLQCGKKGPPRPIPKRKQTTATALLLPSPLLPTREG